MNIKCCDVCYREAGKSGEEKLIKANWKISYKHQATILKLDVCANHRDFFKTCKSYDEALVKVNKLYE
jgi:hypothetical protein